MSAIRGTIRTAKLLSISWAARALGPRVEAKNKSWSCVPGPSVHTTSFKEHRGVHTQNRSTKSTHNAHTGFPHGPYTHLLRTTPPSHLSSRGGESRYIRYLPNRSHGGPIETTHYNLLGCRRDYCRTGRCAVNMPVFSSLRMVYKYMLPMCLVS